MKTTKTNKAAANVAIEEIATTILGIKTLDAQNRDALDFHEVAVWTIRRALEAAYEAGARTKSLRPSNDSK